MQLAPCSFRPARGGPPGVPTRRLLATLMGQAHTRSRIEAERAVAQRSGRPFAVIAFECADPRRDPSPVLRLLRALWPRLRAGDEVGWLGPRRLAVLMPLTSRGEALANARAVAERVARRGRGIEFTVHAGAPLPLAASAGPWRAPSPAYDGPLWRRPLAGAIALLVLLLAPAVALATALRGPN